MKLAEWIRRNQLLRVDVAYKLGISPGHLTHLCSGKFYPSRAVTQRIWQLTNGAVTANDCLWEQSNDDSPS